jgi:hypothetical protein
VGANDDNALVAPRALGNHILVYVSRDFIGVVPSFVTRLTEPLLDVQSRLLQARIPGRIALAYSSRKILDMGSQANCQVFLVDGVHLPHFA